MSKQDGKMRFQADLMDSFAACGQCNLHEAHGTLSKDEKRLEFRCVGCGKLLYDLDRIDD